jgi:hypothetical protein
VPDGLSGQAAGDEVEYPLRTLETIGVFGVLVMTLEHLATALAEDGESRASLQERAREVASVLAALINNNVGAATPRFDGHATDVALALLALDEADLRPQAAVWVGVLGMRASIAYRVGRHFPICTDSYDDLVAMRVGQAPPKEKLMELSTLLPMLAHWHVVLDMHESYEAFRENLVETFAQTTLQLWFPDKSTEDHLYRENAGFSSGALLAPSRLPTTLEELRAHILRLRETRREAEELTCFAQGWSILGLIASRHYRTPVIPAYWQRRVDAPASIE